MTCALKGQRSVCLAADDQFEISAQESLFDEVADLQAADLLQTKP